MTEFYQLSAQKTLETLKTSAKGLTEKEAQARLQEFGLNRLLTKRRIDPFHIFFAHPLMVLLSHSGWREVGFYGTHGPRNNSPMPSAVSYRNPPGEWAFRLLPG